MRALLAILLPFAILSTGEATPPPVKGAAKAPAVTLEPLRTLTGRFTSTVTYFNLGECLDSAGVPVPAVRCGVWIFRPDGTFSLDVGPVAMSGTYRIVGSNIEYKTALGPWTKLPTRENFHVLDEKERFRPSFVAKTRFEREYAGRPEALECSPDGKGTWTIGEKVSRGQCVLNLKGTAITFLAADDNAPGAAVTWLSGDNMKTLHGGFRYAP